MADDAAHLFMLDTAEVSVTIMAASIPAMRVLFRDLRSSARRGYDESGRSETGLRQLQQQQEQQEQQQQRYGNGSNTEVTSQAGRGLKEDDGSDRGILGAGSVSSRSLQVDDDTDGYHGNASTTGDVELGEMHVHYARQ
jgi:hypothetical protein